MQLTNDIFLSRLSEKTKTIIPLEPYIPKNGKMLFECTICKNQWKATPNNILRGRGCPTCAIKSGKFRGNGVSKYIGINFIEISKSRFLHLLPIIHDNRITNIDTYINSSTKIRFECTICKNQWSATPNSILAGNGCPNCNGYKGEQIVIKFLTEYRIQFTSQKKFPDLKYKKPLPLDFYLPDHNIAIEVDGAQHRQPIEFFGGESVYAGVLLRDNIKNEYCLKNNITLIRLEYNGNPIEFKSVVYPILSKFVPIIPDTSTELTQDSPKISIVEDSGQLGDHPNISKIPK